MNAGVSSEHGAAGRVVLGDQVKAFVIEAIISGEFQPGDRVVASSLARQLGVSQAPVREAIRDLVLLGFLQSKPFKGTSVRSFTPKELDEVYTVRAALESLAARLAVERLTSSDVQTLQNTLDDMIRAAQEEDEGQMVRLDNQFHETIMKVSDNGLLYQLWQTLQFGYWTIVSTRMSSYNLEDLAGRHKALLDALSSRDPHRAAVTMQRHIEDLGKPPENLPSEHD
ncbi:MAG TPA: GntR family transcriptional regulator [Anaerolineae bacterium]|nr:GntR family transcriptional regulator [Anaerolineae bacterium]